MGKLTQTTISFDREFLNKLKDDTSSSVEIRKDMKCLPLQPFQLTDLNISLRDILQRQIAKYDEKLGGILLGYQNVKFLERDSVTFDGSFTYLDIEAEFYVFKPIIGSRLVGVVNKKSKNHVGCLVYKTFNVSLPRPNDDDDDSWLGHRAQIGNEVKFEVTFTDLRAKLPYIRGEVVSIICDDSGFSTEDGNVPHNTIIKFNDSEGETNLHTTFEDEVKSSKKKKKRRKSIEADTTNIKSEEYRIEIDENIKKHKKKKHKHSEGDETISEEVEWPSHKKSSKKKYKEEIYVEEDEDQSIIEDRKKHKRKKHKHSKNDSLILEEIVEESPKKSSKKKQQIEQEDCFKIPTPIKKHKSNKNNVSISEEEYVDEENISPSKLSKKKRISKQIDSNLDEQSEKKIKKHKNKRQDILIEEHLSEGISNHNVEEQISKTKRKKHKSPKNDIDYDRIEEIVEDEHTKKVKKHKKNETKGVRR